MKKALLFLSAIILTACSQPEESSFDYKVLKDESKRDIKRTVEIMLPERVSEETLREIAEEIYSKDSDYDRVFIAYRLRENPQGVYWARTDYDPILNVNIMGKTTAEKDALESVDPGIVGEIIGKWDAKNGLETTMYLYSESGKHYIAQVFGPGEISKHEVTLSDIKHGTKVADVEENTFGEYFVMNDSGWLEFWSENGNYYTAPPAK